MAPVTATQGIFMLTFNLLLKQAKLNPKDVYLVRHKDTRIARSLLRSRGSSPYELWIMQRGKFECYQQLQSNDCFRRRKWIASFVVTPANETLFVGMYRKRGLAKFPRLIRECPVSGKPVSAQSHLYYDLIRAELLDNLAGKLTIEWGKGFRAWIQAADSRVSGDKKILAIRTSIHEDPFPGYREFRLDIGKIRSIWPSWQEKLRHCKGIYLLTCRDHGEQYVGKADGDDGFWGRLCQYADNRHGGNEGMKPHQTSGYTVSILEALGTAMQEELDRLEWVWKEKLGTRIWGLNKN
jgi:hypothetical protein